MVFSFGAYCSLESSAHAQVMSMCKIAQPVQASSKPHRAILMTVSGLKNGEQSKHKNIKKKKNDSAIGQSAWNSIKMITWILLKIGYLFLVINHFTALHTCFLCGNLPHCKLPVSNLRVKNTWDSAHKFSETACKIVHLDCMHLTTFIFGWNLWSNAQWSLAIELYKCTLNIGHILGKTQTDCFAFSHLAVSKLLSIRFWNATHKKLIYSPSSLSLCL